MESSRNRRRFQAGITRSAELFLASTQEPLFGRLGAAMEAGAYAIRAYKVYDRLLWSVVTVAI